MPFSDDQRFAVAEAIRDWIHEQPFSQCNIGSDTCPDWPMAFEIRDIALLALDLYVTNLTPDEIRVLFNHYDMETDKIREAHEYALNKREEWRQRVARLEG